MTRSRSWLRQQLPMAPPTPRATPAVAGDAAAVDVTERHVEPGSPGAVGASPSIDAPRVDRNPEGAPHGPTDPPSDAAGTEARSTAPRPAVAPGEAARKSRRQRRREWRQEERARRFVARRSVRFPIFTRAILLWMLIFALVGVAFGASGAFWWAHFNTQVEEIREDTRDIEARAAEALRQIEEERNATLTQIGAALDPLSGWLSEARTIQLAELFAPSVWFLVTLDEEGEPVVGSAFAVFSSPGETLMVTSYEAVRANGVQPGPAITVRNGTEELPAQLVNFDPERDLALLRVDRGDIPVLDWATDEQQATALGTRVFAVSGLGGAGASLTSGLVNNQDASGFLYTAPLGEFMQGGPVVTTDGKVLGVVSLVYEPLGFPSGQLHFAPPINIVCDRLLDCGGGRQGAEEPDGAPVDPGAPPPDPDAPPPPD